MNHSFILMGDIISSRSYDSSDLNNEFKDLINECNMKFKNRILSPLTITLGDEFQGIPDSLRTSLVTIFHLDEMILEKDLNFNLRYVLHLGTIDSPLNQKTSHGMLGEGLIHARDMLVKKYRGKPRYLFSLDNSKLDHHLNRLFSLIASLTEEWRLEDYRLISDMLKIKNNEEVGLRHVKNRSQIWKRRRSLRINDYQTVKELIFDIIEY